MDVLEEFKRLRFLPEHHLGLGDIRITIGQQEDIAQEIERLRAERDALRADASRFIWLADRLQDIAIDLAEPDRFIDDRGDWVNAWRAAIDAAWEE